MIKKTMPAMPSPFKLFAIFMLLLVIIVFTGIGYFLVQKKYIIKNERDKLEAVAELRVGQIVRWRNERLNHIEYIYNNPLFGRLVKVFLENPDNTEKRQEVIAWMKSLQAHELFSEVYLLDANGRNVLSSKNAGGIEEEEKEMIARAQAARTPLFSDLHTAPAMAAHFDIVIPLILPAPSSTIAGVLFMRMSPHSGLTERIQSWPTPSLTAETLLVRRDGDSVLYLSNLRWNKDAAMKFRIPLRDDNVVSVKAAKGAEGLIEGVDYRGVQALAAARKIPDTSWIMIAKIDKKEIYASLREQAWLAGAGMFFLIIGAAVAVRIWWWRQRTGFYLDLYEERKYYEERLRQFAAVVENANDAIFAITLDGVIINWNKGADACFGYKESEVFGKSMTLLIPPDNQNGTAAFLEKIKKGESIEHHETVCRRKDGRNVTLSLSASPIVNGGGKIIGVSFIGSDVTTTRLVKEKLHRTEGEYRALFESSRDAIMMLDRSGFLDCNKATLDLFGFSSKEQFIKKHPSELSTVTQSDGQDSFAAAMNHIEKAYRTGNDFFEWIHIRGDGAPFNAEVMLSRIEHQARTVLQATVRDISRRVSMEHELNRRREQLETEVRERTAQLNDANQSLAKVVWEWQSIFDNINDAISLLAEDGIILKCNAAMEKMFGRTSAEIVGRHCYEVVHGTSSAVENCPFIRARHSRVRETMELSIGERFFAVSVDPLFDAQGNFNGAVHILSDITGRKRIEEELQKSEIKFKTVFEHTGNAIFLVDAGTGMIIDCNSMAERLTGYTRQEIFSRSQFSIASDPEKMKALFYDCAMSNSYVELETTCLHKSGRLIPVMVGGQFVTINNRKVAIGFCFDLTEHNKITERLQELNDAKDRFFSVIGH
ncbi:MAG: PAS domain-containing protein, partial [Victivallaceae bacterium]